MPRGIFTGSVLIPKISRLASPLLLTRPESPDRPVHGLRGPLIPAGQPAAREPGPVNCPLALLAPDRADLSRHPPGHADGAGSAGPPVFRCAGPAGETSARFRVRAVDRPGMRAAGRQPPGRGHRSTRHQGGPPPGST